MKQEVIHDDERAAADAAYNHARQTYDQILAESVDDAGPEGLRRYARLGRSD
jgi:hypothetical protein